MNDFEYWTISKILLAALTLLNVFGLGKKAGKDSEDGNIIDYCFYTFIAVTAWVMIMARLSE